MLFGLARRTARNSRKYHYFTDPRQLESLIEVAVRAGHDDSRRHSERSGIDAVQPAAVADDLHVGRHRGPVAVGAVGVGQEDADPEREGVHPVVHPFVLKAYPAQRLAGVGLHEIHPERVAGHLDDSVVKVGLAVEIVAGRIALHAAVRAHVERLRGPIPVAVPIHQELVGGDHSFLGRFGLLRSRPGLLVPLSGIRASRRREQRKNGKKTSKNGRDMA